MPARAAIRNQRRLLPRLTYRERDSRMGRAAAMLPRSLVLALSVVIVTAAAGSAAWTLASDGIPLFAGVEAPEITGSVTTN